MSSQVYYLDHAAATPLDERVLAAMQPYLTDLFYNPSASYAGGRQARQALEDARQAIALVLGAKANDIVFTAGATESIHLALEGVLRGGTHRVCAVLATQRVGSEMRSGGPDAGADEGRGSNQD